MYFIGYDIGSSSIKASLIEAKSNNEFATAQSPMEEMLIMAEQAGWAEQDPEEWWKHVIHVTKQLLSNSSVSSQDIKAIGISYQMHGLVVVDENQKVLRPAIIWCDSRAVDYGAKAQQILGNTYCRERTLNPPGNFTAAKLAWVIDHEPELSDRIDKFMLPGDFIAMRMSGKATTTFGGLSEGVMYDFRTGGIAQDVCEALGIGTTWIPDIVDTFSHEIGLSQSAADILGLEANTPITYRAGDQPNNALSLNVLQPGEVAATAGTSGVIYGIHDQVTIDPSYRVNAFAHVNHTPSARRIGTLLCVNGTGISNAWIKRSTNQTSYQEMNDQARQVNIGSDGLLVYPFGNGLERMLDNSDTGCSIHGLQFNVHDKKHLNRAIQEGIACSLTYGTEIMKEMGMEISVIRAGEANLFLSDIFQEALSQLTGATIELYNTNGAQGAARGAGIGIGHYTYDDAFSGLHLRKRITPASDRKAPYQELYGRWKTGLTTHYKC